MSVLRKSALVMIGYVSADYVDVWTLVASLSLIAVAYVLISVRIERRNPSQISDIDRIVSARSAALANFSSRK